MNAVRTSYKGRTVDIDVRRDPRRAGSHVVVVVRDPADGEREQRVEYIVDCSLLADAIEAGIEVAQALVDGRLH